MLKNFKKYRREHDRLSNKTIRNSKKIYDVDGNWYCKHDIWYKWFRESKNKTSHIRRYLNQNIGKNIDIIHSYLSSIGLIKEFNKLTNNQYSDFYIENNILYKYINKPKPYSKYNEDKLVWWTDCDLCRLSIKKNDIYIQYFSDKILTFDTKEINISNNLSKIRFNGDINEIIGNHNNSLKNNTTLAIKLNNIYHNYNSFEHLYNDIKQFTNRQISDLEIKQFLLRYTDFKQS